MQPYPGQNVMPTPPQATTEGLRPRGWWYGVAAVVGVASVVGAILLIVGSVQSLADQVADFQRVDAGEQATITLQDTGGYTIYHEFDGASDDFGASFGGVVSVDLTGPDGDVPLEHYVGTITYGTGDHEGVALYSFRAEEPGEYTLSSDGGEGTLAVGRGVGGDLVRGIVGALALGFGGVLAAVVIAVVVGVKRGRERRQRFMSSTPNYWPGAPGPPGGGWGGPPQYPPYQPPPPQQPQPPAPPPGFG